MKHRPPAPPRWSQLLADAQRDRPAPIELSDLLHAVHTELSSATPPNPSFAAAISAVFGSARAMTTCGVIAFALVAVAGWQLVSSASELGPMVTIAYLLTGGLS